MSGVKLNSGENKVTYLSEGEKISALVFVPSDYKEGEKRPAVVMTRPGSGVKEQTAGLYAKELCEKGFVTLAFDPRGFGQSEGRPQIEDPYSISEDTKNSVSFIRTLPQVDEDSVFNVGICMGAGYAAYATALDARVKAVGMISPNLNGADIMLEAFGGRENLRKTMLRAISEARQKFFETGEDTTFKAVPETEEEAGAMEQAQLARVYYLPGKPGHVPNWKNSFSMYNLEALLAFSAFHVIHLLDNVPFFMALGSESYCYDNSIEFYEKMGEPKEKLVVESAGHFDLYWRPEHVSPIVEAVSAFFRKHL